MDLEEDIAEFDKTIKDIIKKSPKAKKEFNDSDEDEKSFFPKKK